MSKEFRLGLVGAGAISRAYEQAIAECGSARLVAVADTNADAAAAMSEASGAAAFTSHHDLADAGVCDAVIVTTPPSSHADIAIDFVTRGLPVLCEKPLSTDFASARHMIAAARDNGVLLSMASKFRFTEDVITARDMIRNGEIGEPLMLENVFTGVVDMSDRWNSNPALSGGGVLIDNGTHSVDIIRFLIGPISEVFAMPHPALQSLPVEDGVRLIARTDTGAEARVETSWSVHMDRSAFIEIYGTQGAIEIGWTGSRIRRQHGGAWEAYGRGYDKVAAFRRQIDHFVGAVTGQGHEVTDDVSSLASVAVIEAAYRSFQSRRWETVVTSGSAAPSAIVAQ